MYRLQSAARLGHSLVDYTFEQHWHDWYKRNIDRNTWTKSRAKWHSGYAKRYFFPFFTGTDGASLNINDIGQEQADAYWDWRISYWKSAEGKAKVDANPTRKSAKSQSSKNVKETPALKTLQKEASALNKIFDDARRRGRLQKSFKFKAVSKRANSTRRSYFPIEEYRVLKVICLALGMERVSLKTIKPTHGIN